MTYNPYERTIKEFKKLWRDFVEVDIETLFKDAIEVRNKLKDAVFIIPIAEINVEIKKEYLYYDKTKYQTTYGTIVGLERALKILEGK